MKPAPNAISCVIPAYNSECWLRRAVESLFDTNYPRLEVLIVDDGSTDSTLDVATRLRAEHPVDVRVLQHPGGANRGVSASRNLGIRSSSGSWICLLDADDYVHPHRFSSTVEPLLGDPTIDAVFGTTEMCFETPNSEAAWSFGGGLFGLCEPLTGRDLLERLMKGCVWATSAIVVRRELLQRAGLFDERLRIAEDCHAWWRMAAVGNIVPGDLTKPVSVYFRHAANSFMPAIENRVAMQEALFDFFRWAARRRLAPDIREVITRVTIRQLSNAMVVCRETNRPDLAMKLLRLAARNGRFGSLLQPPVSRIAIWTLLRQLRLVV